jgi:predicted RNase H-like HicB family nuclease
MELTASVHFEDGSYWAQVKELPGCFASGRTLDELKDALTEAVGLCLGDDDHPAVSVDDLRVDELRVLIGSR